MRLGYYFSLLVLGFFFTNLNAYELPNNNSSPTLKKNHLDKLSELSDAFAALAAHAQNGVVFISVSKRHFGRPLGTIDPYDYFRNQKNFEAGKQDLEPHQRFGLGSGFFFDRKNGLILTNHHVVEGALDITVRVHQGKVYDATVLGRDPHTDLAVLKINAKDFRSETVGELSFTKSNLTRAGELVFVYGSPYGLAGSLSLGVVSATKRGNLNITRIGDFIQTDAAINPGNSGGPLINSQGEVVGINTAIYSRSGGNSGIGFAIPAQLARSVATEIVKFGKVQRGFLGVQAQVLDDELREILDMPKGISGVLVQKVAESSPAAKVKLLTGDIISQVDGKKIKSESEFTELINSARPGSKVTLQVFRNKRTLRFNVTLDDWPSESYLAAQEDNKIELNQKDLGLTLRELNQELKQRFQVQASRGLMVLRVQAGSKAEKSGLNEGDLLLQIDSENLLSIKQLNHLAAKKKKSLLLVERKGETFFLPLTF